MPRKKTKYKRRRRKKVTPGNAVGPLQTKLKAKMIYHEEFNLDPGVAGIPANYIFGANTLYDPRTASGGHQPRGFDQLMLLYDHFVVIASKITLTVTNSDTDDSQMVVVMLRDSSTPLVSPSDIMEYRYIKQAALSTEGGGRSTKTITLKCNPNKFLGRSSPLSDPDLKGSSSSNPAEMCFFHVYGFPTPSGIDTGSIYCQARIEYTAIFIEPKQPSSS